MPRRSSAKSAASSPSSGATVATVDRAMDLLVHIASKPGPDFGITELAEDLSMSKAAVHRVLASLKGKGLVDVDERTRRYSLGVVTLRLGLAYLDRIDVRRLGHPFLERLSARTHETATLSIPLGDRERIYVDQVRPDREVIMSVTIGESFPLHAGASGRALLAFMSDDARAAYLAGPMEALTDRTVVNRKRLQEVLDEVRANGWALSQGERKSGASAVAAPVLGHEGFPVAVVSVCGPLERLAENVDLCREELLAATHDMSRKFGWDSN